MFTYPNMKKTESQGLSRPIVCARCPMHFANDDELAVHMKEKHQA
jgi:hypothetical protein